MPQQAPAHFHAARSCRIELIFAALLAALIAVFFAVRVWHGLWFMSFVDESDHLVGGWAIDSGDKLYRDYVNQHGPTIFMLTQAYGLAFGWSHPNYARLISAALALAAAAGAAASPLFSTPPARLASASLVLGLFASVWLIQGLYMVNYHEVAGCLTAIGLALFAVPAWCDIAAGRVRAAIAGAAYMLVITTAYSFAPAIGLIGASSLWAAWRRRNHAAVPAFLAGAAIAFLLVLIWLITFGDVVGYVVYHLVLNQLIFAKFTALGWHNFAAGLVPSTAPRSLVHCLALVCWAASLLCLLSVTGLPRSGLFRRIGPVWLGYAGLLALCARGGTLFQDGAFLIATSVLLSLALPICLQVRARGGLARLGLCAVPLVIVGASEIVMRQAQTSPFELTRAQLVRVPHVQLGLSSDPLFVRIRALTSPADRILALPYEAEWFMWAGRLPMRKYVQYLAWDAAYAKDPWFGRTRDICDDMTKSPPRLVFFTNASVWGYRMAEYVPCFVDILETRYDRQPDFPDIYVRRDRSRQSVPEEKDQKTFIRPVSESRASSPRPTEAQRPPDA